MKYKVFSIIFSILLVITLPLALCSCSTQKSSKNDEIILRIANWEEYLDEGDWDDDEEIELMVLEQTMINNVNYLLVTDSEEDEADAYILKETGAETEEAYYEFVEDSTELEVISKVFEQMLDDIDLKYE